jgi:ribosomal protein S18 acetylase RimI-like enzyme
MTTRSRPQNPTGPVTFRYEAAPDDRRALQELVESTGFFSPVEADVAVELVDERLARSEASGYHFVFAETGGRMLGYSCYGPIPATTASWDLYWIVVRKTDQRAGLGRTLLAESERLIQAAGGSRVYVDTSSRPQYEPTRSFYERCGYRKAAVLDDFYAPGDGKVIYLKVLGTAIAGD